ncbi:MAG: hypothetical protein H6747_11470 [Deltaproteobacteria bacterium]|nr:hypothetical protein [Deltaproteobacteria bacterium]
MMPRVPLRAVAAFSLLLLLGCGRKEAPAPTPAAPPSPPPSNVAEDTAAAPVALPAEATGLLALPHVTLAALSDWSSVLKPCGCTEELQRGGIERIAHWIAVERRRDPALMLLHAGNLLVEDEAPPANQVAQRALRQQTFVQLLAGLPVAGVALSSVDLERGGEKARELLAAAKLPLLADGWEHGVAGVLPRRVVTLPGGVRLGVFALDPAAGELDRQQELAVAHEKALRAEGATVVAALSNLGLRNSRRLARRVPALDAVVVGAVPERLEPIEEPDREEGGWLLAAPRHGAYLAVLTLADVRGKATPPPVDPEQQPAWIDATPWLPGAADALQARLDEVDADLARVAKGPQTAATSLTLPFWRRQRADLAQRLTRTRERAKQPLPVGRLGAYRSVGLAWTSPVEPTVAAAVARYDAAAAKISEATASAPVPAKEGVASYVGQQTCLGCHKSAADFARDDLHAHAWETLEKAGKTRDLDCVGCHSTGWQRPGGAGFANIERFADVQCEACHGPGSAHVAAAEKNGGAGLDHPRPDGSVCSGCHTPEHAPRFDFDIYSPRLRRPGHGLPAQ